MFDDRPRWLLLPSERTERDIEREHHKDWRYRMAKPKFDWFTWGPISALALIAFMAMIALAVSGRPERKSVASVNRQVFGEPASESKAPIPEGNGAILRKVSIPSAKLLIFELELASGERTVLPVDSKTYESKKVGDLIPLEPPKKLEKKLEYY